MCTGTLALEAKRREPGEGVLGLDGDPAVLERAQTKAESERLAVGFAEGLADRLPYPDDAFDTVLSSLLFHHLDRPTKDRAVRELVRVLRSGGELPWQTGDRLPACSVRFCSCPFGPRWARADARQRRRANCRRCSRGAVWSMSAGGAASRPRWGR